MIPITLQRPVQYEAALQLRRHLMLIKQTSGYNFNIQQVNLVPKDVENQGLTISNTPVINILWGVEDTLNAQSFKRTDGLMENRATVYLDCYLMNNNDPLLERTKMRADIQTLLMTHPHYHLTTESNQTVVRDMILVSDNWESDWQTQPWAKLIIELYIWYGTTINQPYQPR